MEGGEGKYIDFFNGLRAPSMETRLPYTITFVFKSEGARHLCNYFLTIIIKGGVVSRSWGKDPCN